jgi:hypothetical protein
LHMLTHTHNMSNKRQRIDGGSDPTTTTGLSRLHGLPGVLLRQVFLYCTTGDVFRLAICRGGGPDKADAAILAQLDVQRYTQDNRFLWTHNMEMSVLVRKAAIARELHIVGLPLPHTRTFQFLIQHLHTLTWRSTAFGVMSIRDAAALSKISSLRHLHLHLPNYAYGTPQPTMLEVWQSEPCAWRLETLHLRFGAPLSVATASRWLGRAGAALQSADIHCFWNVQLLDSLPGGDDSPLRSLRLSERQAHDCATDCKHDTPIVSFVRRHPRLTRLGLEHAACSMTLSSDVPLAAPGAQVHLDSPESDLPVSNKHTAWPSGMCVDLLRDLPCVSLKADVLSEHLTAVLEVAQRSRILCVVQIELVDIKPVPALEHVDEWCRQMVHGSLTLFSVVAESPLRQITAERACTGDCSLMTINHNEATAWPWLNQTHALWTKVKWRVPDFAVGVVPFPISSLHSPSFGAELQLLEVARTNWNWGKSVVPPRRALVARQQLDFNPVCAWPAEQVIRALSQMPRLVTLAAGEATIHGIGAVLRACAQHKTLRHLQLVTDELILHDDVILLSNLITLELSSHAQRSSLGEAPALCCNGTLEVVAERHPLLESLVLDMAADNTCIGSRRGSACWKALAKHPTLAFCFLGLCTPSLSVEEYGDLQVAAAPSSSAKSTWKVRLRLALEARPMGWPLFPDTFKAWKATLQPSSRLTLFDEKFEGNQVALRPDVVHEWDNDALDTLPRLVRPSDAKDPTTSEWLVTLLQRRSDVVACAVDTFERPWPTLAATLNALQPRWLIFVQRHTAALIVHDCVQHTNDSVESDVPSGVPLSKLKAFMLPYSYEEEVVMREHGVLSSRNFGLPAPLGNYSLHDRQLQFVWRFLQTRFDHPLVDTRLVLLHTHLQLFPRQHHPQ